MTSKRGREPDYPDRCPMHKTACEVCGRCQCWLHDECAAEPSPVEDYFAARASDARRWWQRIRCSHDYIYHWLSLYPEPRAWRECRLCGRSDRL